MDQIMVLKFLVEGKEEQILSANPEMQKIFKAVLTIKDVDDPILLTGETGVGKDLLTKAIHYSGKRKNKELVVATCPTLPETLFESELFGHRKGAFTGAMESTDGLISTADDSTLYLNEISEIDPSLQIKLLRLVEEKVYTRLGETAQKKVNIRIIAATNSNLEELIAKGRFRKDLYYRLKVFRYDLPPLRERIEDVPLLIDHFLKKYCGERKLALDPMIIEHFKQYDWPGNVRELENNIKNVVSIPLENEFISLEFFLENLGNGKFPKPKIGKTLPEMVAELEKNAIISALMQANWVKKIAAKNLGIPESTIRYKIRYYNITNPQ